jgi:hypothetical protein
MVSSIWENDNKIQHTILEDSQNAVSKHIDAEIEMKLVDLPLLHLMS